MSAISSRRRRPRSGPAEAEPEGCAPTCTCTRTAGRHRLLQTAVLLYVANILLTSSDAFVHKSTATSTSRNVRSHAIYHVSASANGAAPASASAFAKRYDRFSPSRLSASRERTDVSSSSSSSNSDSSSSRYGVRKRVKSVIQKAKSRKIAKAEAKLLQQSYADAEEYGSSSSGSGMPAVDDDDDVGDVIINSESVGLSADGSNDDFEDEKNGSSSSSSSGGGGDVSIPQAVATQPPAPKKSRANSLESYDVTESAAAARMSSSEPIPVPSEAAAAAEKTLPEVEEEDDVQEEEPIVTAEPPSFDLPKLTDEQQRQLDMGERVQYQNDMGREGSGFVVLDVKAPPDVVWECLLDFQSYPETIPTVREVTMYTNTHLSGDYRSEKPVAFEDGTMATLAHGVPSTTRAAFTLSKFRLKIAAIHQYTPHRDGDYMVFTLDPACTNLVLKAAKGVWHTQSNPDNKGEVRCVED